MRIVIFVFMITLVFYSCKTKKIPDSFNENLLWGEWHLDSVSNGTSDFQTLFITRDHQFNLFSYSLGNELVIYGCYKNQKLFDQYDQEYPILKLDSSLLVLDNQISETRLFYKKSVRGNPKKHLEQALKGNKLRSKVLGWWKYTNSSNVSEMHYPKSFLYNSFIIHIREDGKAEVFENFKTQPSLLFSYRFYENNIQLQDRCIVTNMDIISIDSNELIISPLWDTLTLRRITEFN